MTQPVIFKGIQHKERKINATLKIQERINLTRLEDKQMRSRGKSNTTKQKNGRDYYKPSSNYSEC
jgi:hypothetical protein